MIDIIYARGDRCTMGRAGHLAVERRGELQDKKVKNRGYMISIFRMRVSRFCFLGSCSSVHNQRKKLKAPGEQRAWVGHGTCGGLDQRP